MLRTRIFSVILPALLTAGPALAGQTTSEPLVTDRPDFTESTVAVTPGRVQLEAGYTFAREGRLETQSLGELLLRAGALRKVELRLGIGSYHLMRGAESIEGFGDMEIGLKWNLIDPLPDAPAPISVAMLVATTIPTGEAELGQEDLQPGLGLAAAWPFSDRFELGVNLNTAYASDGGRRFAEWSGSLALGIGLTERLGGFAELFGFAPDDRPDTAYANGGLTYLLSHDLQFDARIGIGLNRPRPNYFAGLGLAWRM